MSDHADFIRTTRALAQVTNLSPNQIRTNLRRFVNDQTAAQTRAAQQPEGTVPISKNLGPPPDPGMNLAPNAFTPVAVAQGLPPVISQTSDFGTAVTPYVMGTNSTAFGGPRGGAADNDSWTASGGPSPVGGGPYDGVNTQLMTRIWELGTGSGFILYTRSVTYDSIGKAFEISVESGQHITSF